MGNKDGGKAEQRARQLENEEIQRIVQNGIEISVYITVTTRTYSVDKKNQLDVTFCILYFSSNSCSTCFGQQCAHHQELTTA